MADQIEVDLIVEAIARGFDKVSGEFKKTGDSAEKAAESVKNSGLSFTELKSKIELGIGALKAVGKAFDYAHDRAEALGRTDVAGAIDRMDASLQCAADSLLEMNIAGRDLLEWTGLASTHVANLAEEFTRETAAVNAIQAAMQAGTITQERALELTRQLQMDASSAAAVLDELGVAFDQGGRGVENYSGALYRGEEAMDGWLEAARRAQGATKALADEMKGEVAAALDELNMKMGGAVGNELADYRASNTDLLQQQKDLEEQIARLEETQGLAYGPTKDLADVQLQLASAQNDSQQAAERLAGAQQALAENTDPGKQAQLEGKVIDAQIALQNAAGAVDEWTTKLGIADGGIIDNTTRLEELKTKLGEVQDALDENAAAHEEATFRILFSYAQQALAVDGLTLEEIGVLNDLSEKWGLTDAATNDAVEAMLAAVGKLNSDKNTEEFIDTVDALGRRLLGLPQEIIINIRANIDPALGDVGLAPGTGSGIPGGPLEPGQVQGRASGGLIPGGWRGMVGEFGPEPFVAPPGGGLVQNNYQYQMSLGPINSELDVPRVARAVVDYIREQQPD